MTFKHGNKLFACATMLLSMARDDEWIPRDMAPDGLCTGSFKESNYANAGAKDEVIKQLHDSILLVFIGDKFHVVRTSDTEDGSGLTFTELLPDGSGKTLKPESVIVIGLVESVRMDSLDPSVLCPEIIEAGWTPGAVARRTKNDNKKRFGK